METIETMQAEDQMAFGGRIPGGPPEATPWGRAQTREFAGVEGLYRVTTAGHGGYWLSPSRVADVRAAFPGFTPWAGWPWLEEDCDAALTAALWPETWSDVGRWHVWRMACLAEPVGKAFVAIRRWFATPAGKAWGQACFEWGRAHARYWTAEGGFGDGTGWRQHWRRVGDGRVITVNHGQAMPSVGLVSTGQMRAWVPDGVDVDAPLDPIPAAKGETVFSD